VAGLIICGVDDSESAKGAARVARGLSSELGLGLVFLRVVESGASKETVSAITEGSGVSAVPPAKWTTAPVGLSTRAIQPSGSSPRPRRRRRR